MIIGITGSFGSGKTTVANMFRRHGFEVINVDKLYRGIYNKNISLKNKIIKEFGTLDRNQLKKIVFNDSNKLKKFNNIKHPIIIREIKKELSTIIKKYNINKKIIKNNKIGKKYYKINGNKIKIIIDAPLLIEAKAKGLVDKLIVVKCSKEEQYKRILKNKKYTKKEIDNIIKSQMPLKEKIKKADFVVDNSGTINATQKQIKEFINHFSLS